MCVILMKGEVTTNLRFLKRSIFHISVAVSRSSILYYDVIKSESSFSLKMFGNSWKEMQKDAETFSHLFATLRFHQKCTVRVKMC